LFALAFHVHPLGFQCSLDRHWLDGAEKLSGNRGVDAEATEGQAPGQPQHLVGKITTIDGLSR